MDPGATRANDGDHLRESKKLEALYAITDCIATIQMLLDRRASQGARGHG